MRAKVASENPRPPHCESQPPAGGGAAGRELPLRKEAQKCVTAAPGVGVVDANVARVRMDWYCDDGMHPNDLGYREWGEIIADTIVAPK